MAGIRVLLVDTCPSLSRRSVLTFQAGLGEEQGLVLRLVANSGKGCFSKAWAPLSSMEELLSTEEPLTHSALQPLYQGRSVNTSGFLLAVLRHVGALTPDAEDPRRMRLADLAGFRTRLETLGNSSLSLGEDARPQSPRGRRKVTPMESSFFNPLDS